MYAIETQNNCMSVKVHTVGSLNRGGGGGGINLV
jgi:hypothetical protein